MKRVIITTIAALLAILMPICILLGLAVFLPPQYSNTFVGVLDEKMDRLLSVEEDKIIVVGGSSVAFGLDSELLQEYTDMPAVNFGLYAALGTRVMLDMSRAGVREGDIVVIAPEMNAQTMSMYFNSKTTLTAIDDDYSLLRYISPDNIFSVVSSMFEHAGEKIKYMNEGAPDPEGVYNSKSFNELGDIIYPREGNVMELYYDPNTPITLDESILDGEFIDYLNEYIAYCKSRGADVYFSFCPMNELSLTDSGSEYIAAFEGQLAEMLDCEVISYAEDYILPAGYFFDSNFHLNDVGVKYRTIKLAEDINLAVGNPRLIADEIPEPPSLDTDIKIIEGYDENEKYFVFERLEGGNYKIVGLTDEGKSMENLVIPKSKSINGAKTQSVAVTVLGEGFLFGGVAKTLTLPKDSNVKQIMNGAFDDSGLLRLNIEIPNAGSILPPSAFGGTAEGFTIHTPSKSNYKTDYFWSQIKATIIEDIEDN